MVPTGPSLTLPLLSMLLAVGEVGLPGSTTAPPSRLYQAVQSSMMAFCSASVCGMPLPPLYNNKYFAIAFVSSRLCPVGPAPAYAGHFIAPHRAIPAEAHTYDHYIGH